MAAVVAWVGVGAVVAPARAHNFVGAQACGSCHAFAYEIWSQGAHARAHQSLTAQQLGDGRCASCHSSALAAEARGEPFGTDVGPGSGTKEVAVGGRDEGGKGPTGPPTDPTLVGVQCEQCHGAGKLYQPAYVMRDRELSRALGLVDASANGCLACHTDGAPSLQAFDYPTMWARIDHGRGARERHEAALRDEAVRTSPAEDDVADGSVKRGAAQDVAGQGAGGGRPTTSPVRRRDGARKRRQGG